MKMSVVIDRIKSCFRGNKDRGSIQTDEKTNLLSSAYQPLPAYNSIELTTKTKVSNASCRSFFIHKNTLKYLTMTFS